MRQAAVTMVNTVTAIHAAWTSQDSCGRFCLCINVSPFVNGPMPNALRMFSPVGIVSRRAWKA